MRTPIHLLKLAVLVWLLTSATASAFYNPQTGRWLNRDPIGEAGGRNLECFVDNDALRLIDVGGGMPYEDRLLPGQGSGLGELVLAFPDREMLAGKPAAAGAKPPPTPGKTKCASGQKHCPSNHPGANGCGPEGWKGKLVPNKPLWMIDFKTSCNSHDICYGTCGNEKKYCDDEFLADMTVACYMKFGWNSIQPMPPDLQAKLKLCNELASAYHAAVAAAGDSAYTAGQEQGCRCCCDKDKK